MRRSFSKILMVLFIFIVILGNQSSGQDVVALAVKARENLYDHWDFEKVDYYLKQVIGKRHAPAFAYSDYGWFLMLKNQYKEGLKYIEKAAKMDPSDKQLITWNAWAMLWDKRLDDAYVEIKKALKLDPHYGEALYVASMIQSERGNYTAALDLAKKAASADVNWRAIVPYTYVKSGKIEEGLDRAEGIGRKANAFDATILTEVYAMAGKHEKALDFLEKSYELRHPFLPWVSFVPTLKDLHRYPRFNKVVEAINLPK